MFAKKQIENLDKRETQLRIFHQMVSEAASILQSSRQSIKDVGKLLLDAWQLKKELSDSVSNPAIDGICSAALDGGAIGVKLLGAGGGGFMLVMADPSIMSASASACVRLSRFHSR
jgi:D-glycero-alpha-D-manno-heptose-7-phosphate kinase